MGNEQKPSKEIIEEEGIKVLQKLFPAYRCQEFLEKASTEASFDGYVNFYKDRNKSKKEGLIQIPVQVKSSTVDFESNKYAIEKRVFARNKRC